jgi:hypothetical protein
MSLPVFVGLLTGPVGAEIDTGFGSIRISCNPPEDVAISYPGSSEPSGEPASRRLAYAAVLRQIAIYDSIGNRDGAEMLVGQLRALGVSEETISDGRNWAKLHCDAPPDPVRR